MASARPALELSAVKSMAATIFRRLPGISELPGEPRLGAENAAAIIGHRSGERATVAAPTRLGRQRDKVQRGRRDIQAGGELRAGAARAEVDGEDGHADAEASGEKGGSAGGKVEAGHGRGGRPGGRHDRYARAMTLTMRYYSALKKVEPKTRQKSRNPEFGRHLLFLS